MTSFEFQSLFRLRRCLVKHQAEPSPVTSAAKAATVAPVKTDNDANFERARRAMAFAGGRVRQIRNLSLAAANALPDAHFDWIFIDALHTEETPEPVRPGSQRLSVRRAHTQQAQRVFTGASART